MTPILSSDELERYDRQILIHEIGTAGQEKLKEASVLICGAGGLGSPAAIYLAAAGVGRHHADRLRSGGIEHLNRQILHGDADIGRWKVDSAKEKLGKLNSHLILRTSTVRITDENAGEWVAGQDVILDALDNLATVTRSIRPLRKWESPLSMVR